MINHIDINAISQVVFHNKSTPLDNKGTYYVKLANSFINSRMLRDFIQLLESNNYSIYDWQVCENEKKELRLYFRLCISPTTIDVK